MLQNRLKQYKLTKKFSNRGLASVLQINEHKLGKILSGKYQGSFEEFEHIVSKISQTPEDEYYYSTGKHLPVESTHTNTTDNYTELLQIIRGLSATVQELKEEIRCMREGKVNAQVWIPQKIPEHD